MIGITCSIMTTRKTTCRSCLLANNSRGTLCKTSLFIIFSAINYCMYYIHAGRSVKPSYKHSVGVGNLKCYVVYNTCTSKLKETNPKRRSIANRMKWGLPDPGSLRRVTLLLDRFLACMKPASTPKAPPSGGAFFLRCCLFFPFRLPIGRMVCSRFVAPQQLSVFQT